MEKKYTQLLESLKTKNTSEQLAIIQKLRMETPIPGVILLLAEFYSKNKDEQLRSEISSLLNDLKAQSLVSEVIEAIDSSDDDITRQVLIASCWQSGLNYSSFLNKFISYSIEFSYYSTLECYSVVEEWVHEALEEDKAEWKKLLEKSTSDMSLEKKKLIKAIASLL